MFRFRLSSAKAWRNVITAISALVDEAVFNLDPEVLRVRAMDPSHVAMVDLEWRKEAFDEYACDKPASLGINVNDMLKLLRRVGEDEVLDLNLDEASARLFLKFSGKYVRTFSIATLDIAGEEIPTLKVAFNTKARLTTKCLLQTVEDAATISDNIRFEATPEKLTMGAQGDLGTFSVDLDKASEALLDLQVKEPSKATFSLNFLSQIVKAAAPSSDFVIIEFSTNIPIKLSFEIPQGRLEYVVAPYIE